MSEDKRDVAKAALASIVISAVLAAAVLSTMPAKAQSASMFDTCVVTATTTSTSVLALLGTAGCSRTANSAVKVKVVGATPVCVGGVNGTSGNPASLAAGDKCYALTQDSEFPSIVQAGQMTLRVNSGTSLVSVAAINGG